MILVVEYCICSDYKKIYCICTENGHIPTTEFTVSAHGWSLIDKKGKSKDLRIIKQERDLFKTHMQIMTNARL